MNTPIIPESDRALVASLAGQPRATPWERLFIGSLRERLERGQALSPSQRNKARQIIDERQHGR